MIHLAEPSVRSLFVVIKDSLQTLAKGTGFVAVSPSGPVLVTTWHNLTGLHHQTRERLPSPGDAPESIVIRHNRASRPGEWVDRVEELYENGKPRWREHPRFGDRVDFVALPLRALDDVQLYPYALGVGDPAILCGPADPVSVVGFPFGRAAGGAGRSLAIWATGFIASEPLIDQDGLPLFLVDCRTREGQSGSAVIAYRNGGAVTMENGSAAVCTGVLCRFLGIYSGRIHRESDIGMVWKASAIRELVEAM